MLTVYLSSFIFGIILILASLLLGEKETELGGDGDADLHLDMDADADADIDMDMDADAHLDLDHSVDMGHGGGKELDSGGALPFFSVRFWTFFLAAFGMCGALLMWRDVPALAHVPISLATGGGIGTLIWWTFQKLKDGAVETTSLATLQGQEAEVLLAIRPNGTGKIRMLVEDRYIDVLATTKDGRALKRGERVLVVSMDGPTACVTPMSRLTDDDTKNKLTAQQTTRIKDL